LKIHKKLFGEKSFPRAPLRKILQKKDLLPVLSSLESKTFLSRKVLARGARGLGQRPTFSRHKKFSHSRIQRLWLFD
jgi:hypothetical protein